MSIKPLARNPSSLKPSKPTVLAVDDDATVRKLVVMWLTRSKLLCVEAQNGEEALALAQASPETIDAIVLDVMMPGIDGFETLRRLKLDPVTANISVLLLTAHATDEGDIIRAVDGGAVDHVAKPFSGPILVAKVRAMCEQTRRTRDMSNRLSRAELDAMVDSLTRLGNRRSFEARLAEEEAYARRHLTPFAVVVLDIDHFKSFNDTFGHEEGDRVLVHLADAIRTVLRTEDSAFRYGGEEFVVFLRACTGEGGVRVAERLRERLKTTPIEVGDPPEARIVAFSAGVAAVDDESEFSSDTVVARADAALYRAKRTGRDRVEPALSHAAAAASARDSERGG